MLSSDFAKNFLVVLFFLSVVFYFKLSLESSLDVKPDFEQITCLTKEDLEEILDFREYRNTNVGVTLSSTQTPSVQHISSDSRKDRWHSEDPREYLRSLNFSKSDSQTKSFCNHTFEHG